MSKRREYFKLCMFFKIKHGLAPTYLAGNHLSSVADLTRYSLRNSSSIRPIRTRTNKYKSSYFPSTIHSWNKLPFDILQIEHLQPFKTKLSTCIFPKPAPSYYNYGEHLSAIYHTRLRLGHNSLNYHAHAYGLSDTSLCKCGSPETIKHFFFYCPNYATLRPSLRKSICTWISPNVNFNLLLHLDKLYIINLMLRGSENLSTADNISLFKIVQTFIYLSK